MPFRWSKNRIDNNCIVESRQFDQAYANYSSVINGGIDRDNLPENCIDEDNCINQCFGKIAIKDNIANPNDTTYQDTNYGTVPADNNPNGNGIGGLTYDREPVNQGDSFFTITSQGITCEEGMLAIQFKVNTYIPQYWTWYKAFTSSKVALKSVRFQILVDDVIVYTSGEAFEGFKTHILNVNVPISKGSRTITVKAAVRGKVNDTSAQVVLQYWGGQLSLHNLYR